MYQDCPNKPCYLCKKPGHTTMTCPYRIAPEHGCTQAASISGDTLLKAVQRRELNGRYTQLAEICMICMTWGKIYSTTSACSRTLHPKHLLVMQAAELGLCTVCAAHPEYLCRLLHNGKLTLLCCGCIHAAALASNSTQLETTLSLAGTRRDRWQFGTMPKFTTGQCIT